MTDAYEIGIKLALQDGVSAGLAVIERELAEVDRAIDRTSVKLDGLRLVETSPGQARAPQATQAAVQNAAGSSEPAAAPTLTSKPRPENSDSHPPEFLRAITKSAVEPELLSARKISSAFPTTDDPQRAEVPVPARALSSEAMSPGLFAGDRNPEARTVTVTDPNMQVSPSPRDASVSPTAPVDTGSEFRQATAQIPVVPTGYTASQQTTFSSRAEVTASLKSIGHFSPSSRQTSTANAGAGGQSQDSERYVVSVIGAGGQKASDRVPSRSVYSRSERAVAPEQKDSQGSGAVTGNVMLDGRLVGTWLSENLARQAARPPSGTTFFDPRQDPAWTRSGVL